MKKIRMSLLAVVIIISCQTEQKKETVYNDLFLDNLKGTITRVESTPYQPDSTGKIGDMDSCCVTVTEYDSKGYTIKVAQKNKAGKTNSEEEFIRFDNGKIKEINEIKDGKKSGKLSLAIDSVGKYISANHYDSSGKKDLVYSGLTEDKYGNILTGKQYNDSGIFKASWKNSFTNQIYTAGEGTDSTGKLIWKSTATLNDKGDNIALRTTEIKKDSTIDKSYTYKYDSYDGQGNWTQRTELENGKPTKVEKRTFIYAKKE